QGSLRVRDGDDVVPRATTFDRDDLTSCAYGDCAIAVSDPVTIPTGAVDSRCVWIAFRWASVAEGRISRIFQLSARSAFVSAGNAGIRSCVEPAKPLVQGLTRLLGRTEARRRRVWWTLPSGRPRLYSSPYRHAPTRITRAETRKRCEPRASSRQM